MDQYNCQQPVFLCAGEPSGDLYAALYIKEALKHCEPGSLQGVGGREMRAAGVEMVLDQAGFGVFGMQAAAGTWKTQLTILRQLERIICSIEPRLFIAVAYPGLNLLLARYARQRGCRVHYLMPPQAWAWGGFRGPP